MSYDAYAALNLAQLAKLNAAIGPQLVNTMTEIAFADIPNSIEHADGADPTKVADVSDASLAVVEVLPQGTGNIAFRIVGESTGETENVLPLHNLENITATARGWKETVWIRSEEFIGIEVLSADATITGVQWQVTKYVGNES